MIAVVLNEMDVFDQMGGCTAAAERVQFRLVEIALGAAASLAIVRLVGLFPLVHRAPLHTLDVGFETVTALLVIALLQYSKL